MNSLVPSADDRILILGASGFIGKRLTRALLERNVKLRVMARTPEKMASTIPEAGKAEVVRGDIFDIGSLGESLRDVHTAFYLIHSMGGKSLLRNTEYVEKDLLAARNFVGAAESAGIRRVIYLGGLGEKGDELSEHLRSRAEVADILSSSKGISSTVLRAAVIIGAGGASYEMLRYLVERLPVMVCPRWIDTRIQPIAVGDVIAYLLGCLENTETSGRTLDICGPDILTYREMMDQYAEERKIAKRIIFTVPVLTPFLSAYWVDLVTPVPSGIAHPLIEGLKNEVVCRDNSIRDLIPIRLTPYREAVRIAIEEQKEGPGITGW